MNFGGPEFVLAIIAMGTFAGIVKTSIRARHGLSDPHPHGGGKRAKREAARLADEGSADVQTLRTENKRLTDQVETMQDRLIVLERIVTDRGYTLASEIEALRDRPNRIEQRSDV
jgi:hypothetical protein